MARAARLSALDLQILDGLAAALQDDPEGTRTYYVLDDDGLFERVPALERRGLVEVVGRGGRGRKRWVEVTATDQGIDRLMATNPEDPKAPPQRVLTSGELYRLWKAAPSHEKPALEIALREYLDRTRDEARYRRLMKVLYEPDEVDEPDSNPRDRAPNPHWTEHRRRAVELATEGDRLHARGLRARSRDRRVELLWRAYAKHTAALEQLWRDPVAHGCRSEACKVKEYRELRRRIRERLDLSEINLREQLGMNFPAPLVRRMRKSIQDLQAKGITTEWTLDMFPPPQPRLRVIAGGRENPRRVPNVSPPPQIRGVRFYHGTPTSDIAEQILASGKIEPRSVTGMQTSGAGWTEPVAGKIYVTPSRREALGYALGSPYEGTNGYLFEVDASRVEDLEPDEDAAGALASVAATHCKDPPEDYYEEDGIVYRACSDWSAQQWASFLDEVRKAASKAEWSRLEDGRTTRAFEAKFGKKLVRRLPAPWREQLLALAPAVAFEGSLPVVGAWQIRKIDSRGYAVPPWRVDEQFSRWAIPVDLTPKRRRRRRAGRTSAATANPPRSSHLEVAANPVLDPYEGVAPGRRPAVVWRTDTHTLLLVHESRAEHARAGYRPISWWSLRDHDLEDEHGRPAEVVGFHTRRKVLRWLALHHPQGRWETIEGSTPENPTDESAPGPDEIRVVRDEMTEHEALQLWAPSFTHRLTKAYEHAVRKALRPDEVQTPMEYAARFLPGDGPYTLAWIPLSRLMYRAKKLGRRPLSEAFTYARWPAQDAPPGIAYGRERWLPQHLYVLDGNTRTEAAQLRRDTHVLMLVPSADLAKLAPVGTTPENPAIREHNPAIRDQLLSWRGCP